MFEAFISILAIAAVTSGANIESDGKDGFNFYKDYLRGRSDDYGEVAVAPPAIDRMSYFYRTPMQTPPEILAAYVQDYKKRTGNAFKNHMLSKDWAGGAERDQKRSSKAGLSYMMRKQNPFAME